MKEWWEEHIDGRCHKHKLLNPIIPSAVGAPA